MYQIVWKKEQLDTLINYFKHGDFKEIHKLDDKLFGEVTCLLIQKIDEYVTILEDEYNTNRYQNFEEVERNLGGFILYIDGEMGIESHYSEVLDKYHICSEESEFSEEIISYNLDDKKQITWDLELFCFSDFNIVIISNK